MPESTWPGTVGPKDVPNELKHLPGFVVTSYGNEVNWLDEDDMKNLDEILADLDNILAGHPGGGG